MIGGAWRGVWSTGCATKGNRDLTVIVQVACKLHTRDVEAGFVIAARFCDDRQEPSPRKAVGQVPLYFEIWNLHSSISNRHFFDSNHP